MKLGDGGGHTDQIFTSVHGSFSAVALNTINVDKVTGKILLCLIKHDVMKMYGDAEVYFHD
jgi:hypothetical protein